MSSIQANLQSRRRVMVQSPLYSIGTARIESNDTTIREYGSTLYVGLARAVSPTNTNFRLTFLLTRLQESLYEDLAVKSIKFEVYHHFSGL